MVEVDTEDEKAIQMFMSKNPPVRLAKNCLHDLVKIVFVFIICIGVNDRVFVVSSVCVCLKERDSVSVCVREIDYAVE